jgi:hypothetical protein
VILRRCLFCRHEFEDNTVIEAFPGATRIAFDPARGRLWAVCARCGRWNLAPIETRWEVLESLEQITRDQARLLGRTENIGLFAKGDAQIVRVGRAGLREEAWWRYVGEFSRRQKEARRIVTRGKVREAVTTLLLIGVPIWGIRAPETWVARARRKQFGNLAWRGQAACARCGRSDQSIRLGGHLLIEAAPADDGLLLRGYCRSCGTRPDAKFTLPNRLAGHVLRRSLAWQNFAGVSEAVLDAAVRDIEHDPSATAFMQRLAQRGTDLKNLPDASAIAFEIAVNDANERALLALELEELEARWREEEEVAAIVDDELT